MATFGRLLLRLILVPLGAVLATLVCVLIVIFGQWDVFVAAVASSTDQTVNLFSLLFLSPIIAFAMTVATVMMLGIAAIGVIIAEAFAIRGFLFHVGNGALSMSIGRLLIADPKDPFFANPTLTFAAGAGAGIIYWLIAGWTAGLRPVFQNPQPPATPLAPAPAVAEGPANPALPAPIVAPAAKPEI